MIVLLFVAVSMHLAAFCRAEGTYCYAEDKHPYLYFNTKTAYGFVSNKDGIPQHQGCRAVQVWMLCRHGTRWFGSSEYPAFVNLSALKNQVVSNYDAKLTETNMCAQDMNNIKNFSFDIPISNAGLLTEQGHQDMLALGRRLALYFPQLFIAPYSPDKYILLHDEILRTNESAVYFAKGLFGMDFNTSLPATNSSTISLIHPYHACHQWIDSIPESERQVASLDKSDWMRSLIARVSDRLGFTYNLTLNDVLAIYSGCIYYKAWSPGQTSAWCTAFTTQDLEVLEYRKDLNNFYYSGPGNRLTNRLACPLLKDLIDKFIAVAKQPEATHPSAFLYFSHDTMVQMFSTILGLAQDSLPLTSDNMPYQVHRKFRSSNMVPFAANIMAVLYNCSENGLKVGFYLQERAIEVPGCGGGGLLCDLERLDQLFSSVTRDPACMDLSFCAAASGSGTSSVPTSIEAAAIIAFSLAFLHSRQT